MSDKSVKRIVAAFVAVAFVTLAGLGEGWLIGVFGLIAAFEALL